MSQIKQTVHWNKRKWNEVVVAFFLALVPIICAWLYCLMERQYFSGIYLPASAWNDELFYYKMTESVLAHGYPQGYFGFNESHGLYLSFAAWSPVLLLFWVVWGFLFGWNLLSPMLCNIALLSVSFLLFGILVKPDKKQALLIGLLYGTFIPVTRFALSCIPEAELFALFILFLGLAVACQRKYRGWMTGGMFAFVMLMTWMRPYLILLLLTPGVLLAGRRGKKAFVWTGGIAVVTMAVYAMISHYFSAPYLVDLFYTEWIKVYFEQGILAGLHYTLWKLGTSFGTVAELIRANLTVKSGLISAAGLYYLIFLMLFTLLLAGVVRRVLYKDWKGFLLEGQMILCMSGFFVADLLMYRIQEGGRHTLVYIAGFLVWLPLVDVKKKRRPVLSSGVAVFLAVLFLTRSDIPYEFAVPFDTEGKREDLGRMAEQLSEYMDLTGETPNYDNTVIWTFSETIGGTAEVTDFGAYYAVPVGFGINLCEESYLNENLEKLKSRFIGVIPGGGLEERCMEAGGAEIGRCRTLVVYDMRPADD